MYENGKKPGGFAHAFANNLPKTPFFAQKYLIRYTQETFFEEYVNFKGHYLSHCRVIPLQSFGSHIRPQPDGLGLILLSLKGATFNLFTNISDQRKMSGQHKCPRTTLINVRRTTELINVENNRIN
jgi:hypothetical protein